MAIAQEVFEYIIDLGPVIIVPAILLILGLITGRRPHKTLLHALFVFMGLTLTAIILTIFVNFFQPLINTLVINSSKNFQVIDLGMAFSKTIALNSPLIIETIIAIILLNVIMLLLRLTRTINIDIWNFWSILIVSSAIYSVTQIRWMGLLISLIVTSITLVLSDIYAPTLHAYYGLERISIAQTQSVCWAPFSQLINFILNKIPGVKKAHIFFEEIQLKLGFFSEPMVMGFILGLGIGIITRYNTITVNIATDLLYAFGTGLRLAVIMVVIPRAFNLTAKGLVPILEDIKGFVERRITKRPLYIGLDPLMIAGHPAVIGLSIVMIPLTVYIATILPGNRILPGPDLIFIPFIIIWAVSASKGDAFRSLVSAAVIIAPGLVDHHRYSRTVYRHGIGP
ncbi:MAG: PTS transporter subunit IIC [Actinomycetota bacterium]|nr:PTS transporter subunit IIC [Actinomycetota bacterium]